MPIIVRYKKKLMSRSILRIAVPSIVSNITVPLLGLVDTAITGHLGAAAYLAAIAVGSTLFSTTYWLFNFLRMGTGGLTAQAYGAGHHDETAALLWRSLVLALVIGLLLLLFQQPIATLGFRLLAPGAAAAVPARIYFNILIWGAPPMLTLFALNGWLLGMQNARYPMVVAIVQNVVNILVSLTLVVGLHWGIAGVAVGTLVAQWTGAALAFALALRVLQRGRCHTTMRAVVRSLPAWMQLFAVNRDIFLRTLCLVSVMFAFTAFGTRQGETLLAVNALLMQLFLLVSYFMDGFAYAGEALGGRFLGERNVAAFRALVRRLFAWGGGVAVGFVLFFLVGSTTLIALLTDVEAVRMAAQPFLPYAIVIPLVSFSAFLFDGLFIGTTSTRAMLLTVFVASAAFFLLHHFLSPSLGNHALWCAFLFFLGLRGLVAALFLPQLLRKIRKTTPQS